MKINRVILSGGGTGGHIFPAVAIANALRQLVPDIDILFVGALGKMEMDKVPQAGYAIKGLKIAGLNRTNLFKNLSLPVKLFRSFFQVRKIFNEFKPNAVFGVGGYSSFPVLKFAQSRQIPTFIHESNAFAGKANQWLGKMATKIFTGTKDMESFFPAHKLQVTGNPVRKNIIESPYTNEAALLKFGLLPNRKTILIIGGSLGAASINKAIQDHLTAFSNAGLQVIWQTGKPNERVYTNAAMTFSNVYVSSFIDDMSAAYTAADMVVSRSGAMAVAEISITGKPCVFVPYPFAAEDHQTFNAMQLVKEGAALMVKDKEVAEKLLPTILKMVQDDQLILDMQTNIKKFACLAADQDIAETIIASFESNQSN
jgi:UDP-N-acetylglucosamine--N-acetylmuramyl-(pentapeptide) pyrophosphoryl-undecaprenol N-acetylglucosamine transferase